MKPPSLQVYVQTVHDLLAQELRVEELVQKITQAKCDLLQSPDAVAEEILASSHRVGYSRHLLHADPQGRFVVMALVWNPGAVTPVHDHETWGVVGSFSSQLQLIEFERDREGSGLNETETGLLGAGEVVSLTPPRHSNIHQMKNSGDTRAVSIHTYGDTGTVCRIYNPSNGETTDKSLAFCNEAIC